MNRFLRLLLAGVFLLCAKARADEPQTKKPEGISQIVVQRTWCYGRCPIDSLTLNADGSATYSGFENAPRRGFFKGTLEREKFSALSSFLESQNFFELKPQIGEGNIDAPDFLVSVTRDRLPYCVVFRWGGSPLLQEKMEKALVGAGDQIQWQRDDQTSASGVRGALRRPLTPYEARSFADRKPPVKDFPMIFASVELESLDHHCARVETRSDGEGRFQFFVGPGRYSVSFSDYNFSVARPLDSRIYQSQPQIVEVKAGRFAPLTINTRDKTPSRP